MNMDNLNRVHILQSELLQHLHLDRTDQFRRIICPKCKDEWKIAIYQQHTSCKNCHDRMSSHVMTCYEHYMSSVMLDPNEPREKWVVKDWDCIVAFHTGRWELGYWMGPTYSTDIDYEIDYDDVPYNRPLFGWNHLIKEEYELCSLQF